MKTLLKWQRRYLNETNRKTNKNNPALNKNR